MALKGNINQLKDLKSRIRAFPRALAHDIAQRAAPELTDLTQAAFAGGRNVYGDARPTGVDGKPLTLKRTGTTEAQLRFVANGTIVRASLGPIYAKYLIGKYKILPPGKAAMPVEWSQRLGALVHSTPVRP